VFILDVLDLAFIYFFKAIIPGCKLGKKYKIFNRDGGQVFSAAEGKLIKYAPCARV